MSDPNLFWSTNSVTPTLRAKLKSQKPCLIWFTGLSGSGKSTLANALDQALYQRGLHTFVLDGDNVRHGLNKDLGFSETDREENIRRIGEVSKLFTQAGLIVLGAFISPFAADRQLLRELFPSGQFIEVYVATPLVMCEQRDPKGLYASARDGDLKNFTGIDSPYEEPRQPELTLDTSLLSVGECVEKLLSLLVKKGFVAELAIDQIRSSRV